MLYVLYNAVLCNTYHAELHFGIMALLCCTTRSFWRCDAAVLDSTVQYSAAQTIQRCMYNTLGASQSAQRDLHDLLDHALLRKIVQYNAIYSIVQSVTAMGNIRPCPGRCSPLVFPLAGFPSKQRANPSPRAMSQPIIPSRSSQPNQVNQPSPDQPAQPAQPSSASPASPTNPISQGSPGAARWQLGLQKKLTEDLQSIFCQKSAQNVD